MFFRKAKLIRELREEIARLREMLNYVIGQRDSAQQGYEGMKEVAEKALEAAKENQFPTLRDVLKRARPLPDSLLRPNYRPDPDPYSVKHCPECNVSVRSDSWPQECPACHSVFGFEEA